MASFPFRALTWGRQAQALSRSRLSTSAARMSEPLPPPGDNLPFSIANRHVLTLQFALFISTGFGLPFLMVRKKFLSSAF